jgi:predicted RNA-binding Zn-ribbon protein involved in translation (DUF1610 family)
MISIKPRWDWNTHPCPQCGQQALAYDGSVRWRSGRRPGRELATKGPVGFSPRADYETAHYFHCTACGAALVDPVDGRRPHLSVDRRAAK